MANKNEEQFEISQSWENHKMFLVWLQMPLCEFEEFFREELEFIDLEMMKDASPR